VSRRAKVTIDSLWEVVYEKSIGKGKKGKAWILDIALLTGG